MKDINFVIFYLYKGIKINSLYPLMAIAEFLITIKFYKNLLKNLPGTSQNFTFSQVCTNQVLLYHASVGFSRLNSNVPLATGST